MRHAGKAIATLALVLAVAGTATAAGVSITSSSQVKNGSIKLVDLDKSTRAKLAAAGKAGPAGDRGPAGAPGAVGPAGAAGPAGPKGDRGADGTDGTDGTNGQTGPRGPSDAFGTYHDTGIALPNVPVDNAASEIQQLVLPAGKYMVTAKVNVIGPLAETTIRPISCQLVAGAAYDEVTFGANGAGSVATMTVLLAFHQGEVDLRCSDGGQAAYIAVDTKISAIQVATLTNAAV